MFKAYLRTEVEGQVKRIRVFPKSKRQTLFPTMEAAVKRLESLKIPGQGIVAPKDWDGETWNSDTFRVFTVAV